MISDVVLSWSQGGGAAFICTEPWVMVHAVFHCSTQHCVGMQP